MKSGAKLKHRSWITIHRRLELPCWPRSEHGPAAICHSPEPSGNVAGVLRDLQRGSDDYSRLSGLPPQRVLLILPVKDSVLLGDHPCFNGLAKSSMALSRDGWALPPTDADVICLWDTKWYFPKLTLRQIAERLLTEDQSAGGIYSSGAIAQMLQDHRNAAPGGLAA